MQQPRPPVTIRDPAHRAGPVDVPDDDPGPSWLPVLAGLVVLGLLAWASLSGTRSDQRDRDEQARRDGVVALSLAGPRALEESRGPAVTSRRVLVELEVALRNDGPREVRVNRAAVGEFEFLGEVRLPPGATASVPLSRTATCAQTGLLPDLDLRPEVLAMQVDTLAGLREVVLRPDPPVLERLTTSTRRACGFLPVEEAVDTASGPLSLLDDGFVAPLEILNSAVRPFRLTAVDVAPGLAVELRTAAGDTVSLPAYVAPSGFGRLPSVTRYELRGRVECERLRPRLERDLGRVAVEVDDGVGGAATSRTSLLGDTGALRQLVERSCGVTVYGSRAS